jgi:putative membrane protein
MSTADARVLESKLNKVAWGLSAVVLLLVGLMRRVKIPSPVDFGFLPPVHAGLNALTAVVLVAALVAIKRRNVALHRGLIFTALGASTLFLLSYVAYHFTKAEVIFGDLDHDGVLSAVERAAVAGSRPLYLALLASHIVLAAVVLPFVLFTFNRAFTRQFERHARMARWVFPIWLYVAVTGPVCFAMLRPYYP